MGHLPYGGCPKGAPFSALESPLYLLELGMEPGDPLMHQVAALFFSVWQDVDKVNRLAER